MPHPDPKLFPLIPRLGRRPDFVELHEIRYVRDCSLSSPTNPDGLPMAVIGLPGGVELKTFESADDFVTRSCRAIIDEGD